MNSPLTREECDELNQLLEAKHLQNLGSPLAPPVAATKHTDAGSPCPAKPALSDCEACENMRVSLNWEDCIVRPCPHCRADEALAFAASRAEADEAVHDTIPCPPPDPWDLASEELVMTADLRDRQYLGDRAEHDPLDDRSDIEAHDRFTSYPWGSK